MLWNPVLPVLDGATPVEHFSWDHKHPGGKNGGQVVMDQKAVIVPLNELGSGSDRTVAGSKSAH